MPLIMNDGRVLFCINCTTPTATELALTKQLIKLAGELK